MVEGGLQHRDEWEVVDRLSDLLFELIALAASLFGSIPKPLTEADRYANMGLTFLGKQIDHATSLLALNRSRDSVLIARSMIEGLVQLTWASKRPGERARRWWDYDVVQRLRSLDRLSKASIDIPNAALSEATDNAARLGHRFMNKKGRERRSRGETLGSNSYVTSWTGKSVCELCGETGYLDKYYTFYDRFSDWHHWGPASVGEPLYAEAGPVEGQAIIGYQSASPSDTAMALANGLQCLVVTLHLMDEHLEAGLAAKIEDIANRYARVKGGE